MDASDQHAQPLDLVASTGWMFGSAVAVAALAFLAVLLGEWLVYDVRIFGPSWGLAGLTAATSGWMTLMSVGAQRLRVDDGGIAFRRLWRDRRFAWNEVQLLGVRPARLPVVNGVITIVSGLRAFATPWALSGSADPTAIVEHVRVQAERYGAVLPVDAAASSS